MFVINSNWTHVLSSTESCLRYIGQPRVQQVNKRQLPVAARKQLAYDKLLWALILLR